MRKINDKFYQTTVSNLGNKVQLKPYEIPSYIEFIREIPRISGSEKVDYSILEKDALEKLEKGKKLIK